jgi:hypothetical protein
MKFWTGDRNFKNPIHHERYSCELYLKVLVCIATDLLAGRLNRRETVEVAGEEKLSDFYDFE